MKKALIALAVVGIVLTARPAHAAPYRGPCRNLSVPATIRCAVKVWPVPGGAPVALAIADRESGFSPGAVSPSGTYLGVYQIGRYHIPAWSDGAVMQGPWWRRWLGDCYNDLLCGRFNVILAIRVAHFGGWGPWGG